LVEEWFKIARDDLNAAHACYEKKLYLHTAYMCQQCIEKAIKGRIQKDAIPKPIHNLLVLFEDAGLWNLLNNQTKEFIKQLNTFYISARYPGVRDRLEKSLNQNRVDYLLLQTKEVFEWLYETTIN